VDDEIKLSAYEPELQARWRKDVGVPFRAPRAGYEEVVKLVDAAWPPTVLMRENSQTTDIVIRLNCSSRQLTPDHKRVYFGNFMPLKRVFEDALSMAAAAKESTIRWKLAAEAYHAYKLTWLCVFRSLYLDQFDPRINPPEWLSNVEKTFSRRRPPGRLKKDDDTQLRSRFKLLVGQCERLRREIGEHQAKKSIETEGDHVHILRSFWKEILKIPGGVSILGGEAFLKIPYGKQGKPAKLEDLTTWKPRQLAIALLALERKQDYHTIERKFPLRKKPKR